MEILKIELQDEILLEMYVLPLQSLYLHKIDSKSNQNPFASMVGLKSHGISGGNIRFIPVMPAKAGIQVVRSRLDSRFCGNDNLALCEYLCNVGVLLKFSLARENIF